MPVSKETWAEYGQACANLEIWTNRVNELKQKIAAESAEQKPSE